MTDRTIYPQRNEVHRALFAMYPPVRYGYLTREMGHFIEQERGGSGVSWSAGAPVQWYIDDIRGETWPQVVLPDGHIFTCAEDDIKVVSERQYRERLANIANYIVRRAELREAGQ